MPDMFKVPRDILLELRAEESPSSSEAAVRETLAVLARKKFDIAAQRLAAEQKLPSLSEDAPEHDMLDEASAIGRGP